MILRNNQNQISKDKKDRNVFFLIKIFFLQIFFLRGIFYSYIHDAVININIFLIYQAIKINKYFKTKVSWISIMMSVKTVLGKSQKNVFNFFFEGTGNIQNQIF